MEEKEKETKTVCNSPQQVFKKKIRSLDYYYVTFIQSKKNINDLRCVTKQRTIQCVSMIIAI